MRGDTKDWGKFFESGQEYLQAILDSYEVIFKIEMGEGELSVLYQGRKVSFDWDYRIKLQYIREFINEYIFIKEQKETEVFLSRENLAAVLNGRGNSRLECRLQYKGERPIWIQAELLPAIREGGQELLCLLKRICITDHHLLQLGIEKMIYKGAKVGSGLSEIEKDMLLTCAIEEARLDALTLLYNHRAMNRLVNYELLGNHVNSAILFIDLDNFKEINDRYGHLTGDKVLKTLAKRLKLCVGQNGIAGRIGGDEFAVYLPAGSDDALGMAKEVCGRLQMSLRDAFPKLYLTCSIGVALCPEDGEDYATLLGKADKALYKAKKMGKNQYAFYGRSSVI